jgi:hypothetical protein
LEVIMARRRPRDTEETVTVSELVARTTTSRLRRWSAEALPPEDASRPDERPRHRRLERSTEAAPEELTKDPTDTAETPPEAVTDDATDDADDTVVLQAPGGADGEETGPPPDRRSRKLVFATVGVAAVVLVAMGAIMLSGPGPQSGSARPPGNLPSPPTDQAVTTTSSAQVTASSAATMTRSQEAVSQSSARSAQSQHANTPPRHRPASKSSPFDPTQNYFSSVMSSIESNWPPRGCAPSWHC